MTLPHSCKFAVPVSNKGKNKLLILDVLKNKKEELITMLGISSFNNPVWSPDGNAIVFLGLVEFKNVVRGSRLLRLLLYLF